MTLTSLVGQHFVLKTETAVVPLLSQSYREVVLLIIIIIIIILNLDEVSDKNTMTMMVINEGEGTMRTSSILVKSRTKTLTRTKVADPVALAPGGLSTKLNHLNVILMTRSLGDF